MLRRRRERRTQKGVCGLYENATSARRAEIALTSALSTRRRRGERDVILGGCGRRAANEAGSAANQRRSLCSFTHSRCRADRSYYRKKRLSAFSRRKKEAPENRPLLVLVIGALTHTHAVAFESAPLVQQSAAGLAAIRDCCLT